MSADRDVADREVADRDGGDIFGTKSRPGVKRGKYWDDRLQQWLCHNNSEFLSLVSAFRSEARRAGKECRARRAP